MGYKIGEACNVGVERQGSPNQDTVGVLLPRGLNRKPPLLVVADGMGGAEGGSTASSLVVEKLLANYRHRRGKDLPVLLREAILAAHRALLKKAKKDDSLQKMGTTVAAAILDGEQVFIANVGDSRIYIMNSQEIRQVSHDHSYVADLVRTGELSPTEARNHPDLNRLTMAISARRQEIEVFQAQAELDQEDVLVLCSDGLWGVVADSQIWRVAYELEPQAAADRLVEMANSAGGPDNISVIVARRKGSAPRELID